MDITPSSSRALRQRLWSLFLAHSSVDTTAAAGAQDLVRVRRLSKNGLHACLDALARRSTFRGLFIGSEDDSVIDEAVVQLQMSTTQNHLWKQALALEGRCAEKGAAPVRCFPVKTDVCSLASNDAFAEDDFYGEACYQSGGGSSGRSPVAAAVTNGLVSNNAYSSILTERTATIAWSSLHAAVVLYLVDVHRFAHSFLATEVAELRRGAAPSCHGVGDRAKEKQPRAKKTPTTKAAASPATSPFGKGRRPLTPTKHGLSSPQDTLGALRSPGGPLRGTGTPRRREECVPRPPVSFSPQKEDESQGAAGTTTPLSTSPLVSPRRSVAFAAVLRTPTRDAAAMPPHAAVPFSDKDTNATTPDQRTPRGLLGTPRSGDAWHVATAAAAAVTESADAGKPAPPPLRKHTQREAAELTWQQRASTVDVGAWHGCTPPAEVNRGSAAAPPPMKFSSLAIPAGPAPSAIVAPPSSVTLQGRGFSGSPSPRRPNEQGQTETDEQQQAKVEVTLAAVADAPAHRDHNALRQRSSSEANAVQPRVGLKGRSHADHCESATGIGHADADAQVRRPKLARANETLRGPRRVYTTRRPHTAAAAKTVQPVPYRGSGVPPCCTRRPQLAEAWPGRRREPSFELEAPPTTRNDDGLSARRTPSPSPAPIVPLLLPRRGEEKVEDARGRRSHTVQHTVEGRCPTAPAVRMGEAASNSTSGGDTSAVLRYASPEKPARSSPPSTAVPEVPSVVLRSFAPPQQQQRTNSLPPPTPQDLWADVAATHPQQQQQPPTQTSRRRQHDVLLPQPSPFSTTREPYAPASHVVGTARESSSWLPSMAAAHETTAPSPTPTPREEVATVSAERSSSSSSSAEADDGNALQPLLLPPPPDLCHPTQQPQPSRAASPPDVIGVPRLLASAFTSPLVSARASLGSATQRHSGGGSSAVSRQSDEINTKSLIQPAASSPARLHVDPHTSRQPVPMPVPRDDSAKPASPPHCSPELSARMRPPLTSPPSSEMRQRTLKESFSTPPRRQPQQQQQPSAHVAEVTSPPPRLSHRARVRSSSRGGRAAAVPTPPRVPQTRVQVSPTGSLQVTPRRRAPSPCFLA